MLFNFKAQNLLTKEIIEDSREAIDRLHLSQDLKKENFILLSAEEKTGGVSAFQKINEAIVRIKLHDKIVFASNLSAMMKAGLALSHSLSVLSRQTKNPKFKRVIDSLINDVNGGKPLSEAMAKFPKVFSAVMVAMVSAGEQSGDLPGSLKIVSDQMEKSYALRKKVKGALMYPSVVILAMIIIGILMLMFVVPNLTATFVEFKVELPLTTKIVISMSNFLRDNTFIFIGLISAGGFAVYKFHQTKRGKRSFDFLWLHMPLISGIVKNYNSAVTARTLSSLIASGVSMIESIEITSKVVQNSYYQEVLIEAGQGVSKGNPLSQFFQKRENLYPILVGEMALVGEETGKLSEMLLNIAVFYENEVEAITKDMSTIIEPFLMLMIGGAVGFFAVSMIQPMYAISSGV